MASGFSRIRLLDRRLMELARDTYADADARRLAARLRKHCDSLFTFLDCPDVPFDNNHAERMIRPAVVPRKNNPCNRSEKGAATQAVLMSGANERLAVATFTADAAVGACVAAPDGVTAVAGDRLGRMHFLRLENLGMLESKP